MSSAVSRREAMFGLVATGANLFLDRRATRAEFHLRQFHDQRSDSSLHKCLVEMWKAVRNQTDGRVLVQTFAENDHLPGGDRAAFKMLMKGDLDFLTLNGGMIGTVVPAINVQSIPFVFSTQTQVYKALDTDLGDYLCEAMEAHGIYGFRRGCFANGFQQITCSIKPIRTAADLQGLKIRTPAANIYVELWKALGATTVVTDLSKEYEALKSGAAQAQSDPLSMVEDLRLYEVQKYASITNHIWAGFNLIANLKMWKGLPPDVQSVIQKNVMKYVPRQRAANDAFNARLRPRLIQQGMVFNGTENSSFRDRLGAFYSHWKRVIGEPAWSLLEASVGKVV